MTDPVIAVISQPRYIPACNYLHRMMVADIFVWLDTVQYTPRDYENRNRVKGPQGTQWLSVPVIQAGRGQPIKDTMIDNGQDWQDRHRQILRHFYGKAPYGREMLSFMDDFFLQEWQRLVDLDIAVVRAACDRMNIECKFHAASETGVSGQGEMLLIDICKAVGTNTYLSGSNGRNYIHPETWAMQGIGLAYHDYDYPVYPQMHGDFAPWMSFLDMAANVGFEAMPAFIGKGHPGRDQIIRESGRDS